MIPLSDFVADKAEEGTDIDVKDRKENFWTQKVSKQELRNLYIKWASLVFIPDLIVGKNTQTQNCLSESCDRSRRRVQMEISNLFLAREGVNCFI